MQFLPIETFLPIKTEKLRKTQDRTAQSTKNLTKQQDMGYGRQKQGVVQTANSTKNFSKLANTIDGGSGSLVGAYATLAANVFAASAAFNALAGAARFEQLKDGLDILGTNSGRTLGILASDLKAVDYGDQYLQLRPKEYFRNGFKRTTSTIKPTKRSRHVSKMMGTGFKNAADKAAEKQFYGLGNVDEFVTMSMMSPEFQTWLMAIPDIEAAQNGETKSLWDRFTEIITNILNTLRKDPDFVRDRGVEGGANLLNSAIKSVMEVAAFNGNINRNLAFMGYESVSEWQTIKGANAAKAEAEEEMATEADDYDPEDDWALAEDEA